MGWSWAFWFIQELHEQILFQASRVSLSWVLREGWAPPPLTDAQPLGLPYCDNLNILGTDPALVLTQRQEVQAAFEAKGFNMHEETEALEVCDVLGATVDGSLCFV